MPWKLIILTSVFAAGLYYLGYGPDAFRRAASDLSRANAEGVSPRNSDDPGWGTTA